MTSLAIIGPAADTTPAGAGVIDLDDRVNFRLPIVSLQFGSKSFHGGIDFGTFERDAVARGNQPPPVFKTMQFGVLAYGTTRAGVQANMHKLETVLNQARAYARLGSLGQGVVFVYNPGGTAYYFDVVGGRLDEYDWDAESAALVQGVMVTLYVRPFARGAATTITTSGVTTDCVVTYRIADTNGDADALSKFTITDSSIGGKIIQRVRMGRRSLSPLLAADFTPLLTPTTLQATFADATARGGSTPRYTVVTIPGVDQFNGMAQVVQPNTGNDQGGEVVIWARCRDSSPYVNPTDTATQTTSMGGSNVSGTLPPDTYLFRVAAVDSAGVESAAGYPSTGGQASTAAGVIDTFPTGTLTTTYAAEQLAQSGYTGGQNLCSPDAAYEGAYGYRSISVTPLSTTTFTPSVNRLHKAAYDIASAGTGTQTVYCKFRVTSVPTADPSARSFIAFVYNDTGGLSSSSMPGLPYGVLAGLLYIGNNIWQTIAPSNSSVYITLIPGQWYTAAVTFVVSAASASVIQGTISLSINGQGLLNALAYNSSTAGGFTIGILKCGVGTVIGDGGGATAIAANDVLVVDFDQVGATQTAILISATPSWNAITGASTYNVYVASALNPTAWYKIALGNVLTTTVSAPFTVPPGTLPQARLSGIVAPALLRALILPPNAAATGGVPTLGGQPQYGQSKWEWVCLGTALLPAIPPQDGTATPAGWTIQIQAAPGGANFSTIDCDTIVLLPADEDQLVAEAPGALLPSLGSWVFDLNRLDREGVTVTPTAGGTATAYASLAGRMPVGQGDTTIIVMLEVSDGAGHFVADLQNTKSTIGAVVTPRYELP